MGMLCKVNFWYIFEVALLALLQNLAVHEVDAHILVYRRQVNQLIEEYNDLPAKFGAPLPSSGLKVFAVPAHPSDYGCAQITKPPSDGYPPTAKFVSLISRGGDCTFERKVRVAQNASYYAVIVYNNEGDDLEQMSADNSTGIHIPAVFVGQTTGTNLRSFYTNEIVLIINDELPFNINTQLILPFSILIGLCFLIMVFYMIYKCIREQRRQRRYRLPKSMLKKIPILRYTKNNTDLVYETCVICLEDFVEDDKVRVLPCRHPYHSHCIDPWLTQNRRVCPICKRKVFTKGEGRSSRNRQPSLDSVTDTDDDTTPLLQQPNGSGTAAGASSAAVTTATAATTSAANTTRHGTFRRDESSSSTMAISATENASDDENALLTQQSTVHGVRRMNPFDRSPNLPPDLVDMLNENQRSFWSSFNLNFLFRRTPTNISVAAPPYLESVETGTSAHTGDNHDHRSGLVSISATASVPTPTSNNIMNPNLSGSFKDDDDLVPHSSIYEPIGACGDAAGGAWESDFLQTPSRGGIGVVALPNTSTDDVVVAVPQSDSNSNERQFLI